MASELHHNNKATQFLDTSLFDVSILVATTLLTHIKKVKKTYNCQNEQRQSPRSVEAIYEKLGPIFDVHIGWGIHPLSNWIVNTVICCPEFAIEYPTSHNEQLKIAKGFEEVSGAAFKCWAGAINGMLIWIHKHSPHCCQQATCQDGKLLCGRRNRFGFNLKTVAGVDGRCHDISIMYPANVSDCLAFEGMKRYTRLEEGMLQDNSWLSGDNACVNTR